MALIDLFSAGESVGIGLFALIVILTIVQIAPIKVNPWSKMLRCIGRMLNVELSERISENEANSARYRIIRFDDEIRHKTRHSEEHFGQILDDIHKYENYCLEHPKYQNDKAKLSIEDIRRVYKKCRDENDFLV